MRIRTHILEILEHFTFQYNEFSGPRLPAFVQTVWVLIGASTKNEPGSLLGIGGGDVREDGMVAQAIRFLSIAVKSGLHAQLFAQQATLVGLCERIIVPSISLRGGFQS
jgi:exportin-2 (importin alpha re-exporter)